jgi:hypothetical protein
MEDNLEREKWRFHRARERERDIPERESMVLLVFIWRALKREGKEDWIGVRAIRGFEKN